MNYLIVFSLLLVSAIAKGFCDRIRFKPSTAWFNSDWTYARGNHSWDKRTWLTKNIFSFVSDGWHFFDAVRVLSLCILITLCTNISVFWAIAFYIIHGLIFETLYRIK